MSSGKRVTSARGGGSGGVESSESYVETVKKNFKHGPPGELNATISWTGQQHHYALASSYQDFTAAKKHLPNLQGYYPTVHRKSYANETHATREELRDLYYEGGGLCFYTGKPFGMGHWDRPSLDRMDSSKGFTKENVVWARWVANQMKNALSVAQFEEECRAVVSISNL